MDHKSLPGTRKLPDYKESHFIYINKCMQAFFIVFEKVRMLFLFVILRGLTSDVVPLNIRIRIVKFHLWRAFIWISYSEYYRWPGC
jgi:hypothetical protein